VTKYIATVVINFVTPVAAAKHVLLFRKLASEEVGSYTSKSDLSNTTKCDQMHINGCYKFGHT
jgi:hypothetical protein